ncbi:MAG TPA: hypothetical protein VFV50_02970 [Bdellovibrionales bacterium]|nr:hypothetical protein [Bdellovibrionales bacterium]
MENLAPPLRCLIQVRSSIENGESTLMGVRKYLQAPADDFTPVVARWLFEYEQGLKATEMELTRQRKVLLEVLRAGLSGQAIHSRLVQLEDDFVEACRDQMASELDTLPMKMLIPLLLFQFPAYLLLLFGPLMSQFLRSLES